MRGDTHSVVWDRRQSSQNPHHKHAPDGVEGTVHLHREEFAVVEKLRMPVVELPWAHPAFKVLEEHNVAHVVVQAQLLVGIIVTPQPHGSWWVLAQG